MPYVGSPPRDEGSSPVLASLAKLSTGGSDKGGIFLPAPDPSWTGARSRQYCHSGPSRQTQGKVQAGIKPFSAVVGRYSEGPPAVTEPSRTELAGWCALRFPVGPGVADLAEIAGGPESNSG
jgi:hypothetical protein